MDVSCQPHTPVTVPSKINPGTNRTAGPSSSVGIAARYGLGGPGIECRWGRNFLHPSRPALGPNQSHTIGTGCFPGVKRPRRGVDHPPHLAQRLKKE
jgi:hypothetical protein